MSIAFAVTCLTCKAWAPEVYSSGFLGVPQLAPEEHVPVDEPLEDPIPSFGFFFDGLRAVGLEPYDLVRFHEFLAAHDGHRVALLSDHDDRAKQPDDLVAFLDDARTPSRRGALEAADAERETRTASGEFINARYEVTCATCGASHTSGEFELLRATGRKSIDLGDAAVFLKAWNRDPGFPCWNMYLAGVADPHQPFMEQLVAFVRAHGVHGLRATCRT